METKRLILAIVLSVVIIMAYQYFFMPKPKPRPVEQPAQEQPVKEQGDSWQNEQASDTKNEGVSSSSGKSTASIDIFSKKKKTTQEEIPQKAEFEAVTEDVFDEELKEIIVETDLFTAIFTNKGAGLKSFILKNYNDDTHQPMDLISSRVNQKFGPHEIYPFYFSPFENQEEKKDFFLLLNQQQFKYDGNPTVNIMNSGENTKEILFKYSNIEKNISVYKRFIFSNNSYVFEVNLQVVKNGRIIEAPIVFGPDLESNVSENRMMQAPLRIDTYNGQDKEKISFASLKTEGNPEELVEEAKGTVGSHFEWAAYDTNYFAAIFKTRGQIDYTHLKVKNKIEKDKPKTYSYIIVNNPNLVYLGPKDEKILEKVQKNYLFKDLNKVVDYGWMFIGSIASIMLKGIVFIYGFIPNYGWALVIFTIFIKILLFPLTYASSVSMAKMQTLQPKIKAIKKKYKNLRDPQQRRQMNEETMALYRQEKVNPAGGCLPMLLQMPILFAFFRLLPISINFRHEPWILWITDLSVKDPFYILPILMGVTQIIVTKMSPTSGDSTQKKLAYIMPVVFVLLFMHYSAGLNLYWFISNLLQVGQQYIINKKIFKEKKEEDRQKRALKRKKRG